MLLQILFLLILGARKSLRSQETNLLQDKIMTMKEMKEWNIKMIGMKVMFKKLLLISKKRSLTSQPRIFINAKMDHQALDRGDSVIEMIEVLAIRLEVDLMTENHLTKEEMMEVLIGLLIDVHLNKEVIMTEDLPDKDIIMTEGLPDKDNMITEVHLAKEVMMTEVHLDKEVMMTEAHLNKAVMKTEVLIEVVLMTEVHANMTTINEDLMDLILTIDQEEDFQSFH